MPPLLDPRMMWVLGQVKISGGEGISIKTLFDKINSNSLAGALDSEGKSELWEEILVRDDLLVGDEKGHKAMIKKNVCLQDVFDFGLQERKITFRNPANAPQDASTLQTVEDPRHAEPTPTPSFHTAEASSPPSGPENHVKDGEDSILVGPRDANHPPQKSLPEAQGTIHKAQDNGSDVHTQKTSARRSRKPSKIFDPSGDVSNTPTRSQRTRKPTNLSPDPATPSNNQKYLRHAVFTSHEELVRQEDDIQRKAGVPRVYIDPYGSEPPKPLGRPKKQPRMIAVFKSNKLKVKDWFTSHAKIWTGLGPSITEDHLSENPRSAPKPKKVQDANVSAEEEKKDLEEPLAAMQPPQPSTSLPHDMSSHAPIPPPQHSQRILHQTQFAEQSPPHGSVPQQMSYPAQFYTPQHQAHTFSQQRTVEQQHTPQSTQFLVPHILTPQQYAQAMSSSSYASQSDASSHINSATKAILSQSPYETTAKQPYFSPYAADGALNNVPSTLPYTEAIIHQYQTPTQPSTSFSESSTKATIIRPISNTPQTNINQHAGQDHLTTSTRLAKSYNPSVSPAIYAPILPPIKKNPSVPPQTATTILPSKSVLQTDTSQTRNLKRKASTSEVIAAKRQQTTPILPPQRSLAQSAPLATSTQIDVVIPPSTTSNPHQSLESVEDKFEKKLAVADVASISHGASISARFAAEYDDVLGNVVLRMDQENLEFWGRAAASPLLTVPIRRFTKFPNISQKGSNPMELFVYAEDEDGKDIMYRFNFGLTSTAFAAANNTRAKLSAGWTFHQKANDNGNKTTPIVTEEMRRVYPFFCPNQGCGKRWKNKEGLIYHATKSNTPCSKSFDPAKVDGRKAKANKATRKPASKKQRKKGPAPSTSTSIADEDPSQGLVVDVAEEDVELPKFFTKADQDEEFFSGSDEKNRFLEDVLMPDDVQLSETNYQSDSSTHSSVQSDLEWAWKVAQSQPKLTSKRRRRNTADSDVHEETAQPHSSNGRRLGRRSSAPVNADILQGIIDEVAELEPTVAEELSEPAFDTERKLDIGAITKEIILEMVRENHGVFPGGRSLWYAVFATCVKRAGQLRLVITPEACSNALIILIIEAKLKDTVFEFMDKTSKLVTRHVITEPSIAMDSPAVEMIKETVRVAHPDHYVPSKFAPSSKHLVVLQQLFEGQTPTALYDERAAAKRRKVDGNSRQKPRSSEAISEEEVEDEEISDGVQESRQLSKGRHSLTAESTREKLRRATKRRWAAIKANGGTELKDLKDCVPDASFRQFADPKAAKATPTSLTAQEKQRRAAKAAEKREQFWHQDLPFLQSAETATWSEVPAKAKKPLPPRRGRLPEPITYLQDEEDGSWSIRPFGHGVNPIHTRPSRQAIGNPHSAAYTNRRDNGFRPVLEPTGVRKYLPGPPSKHILNSASPAKTRRIKRDSTRALLDDPDFTREVSKRARTDRDLTSITPDGNNRDVRISKATGKPVRSYNRTSHGPSTLAGTDSPSISTPISRPRREIRKPARIQEAVLAQSIESPWFSDDLPEGKLQANPGLETLPGNFGLGGNSVKNQPTRTIFDTNQVLHDRILNVFNQPPSHPAMVVADIEGTAKWEQGPGNDFFVDEKIASNIGWINHTLDSQESSSSPRNLAIKWSVENAFTMETLPYYELEDLSLLGPDASTKSRYQFSEPETPIKVKEIENKEPQVQKTRYVSVLASKFGMISDDPVAAGKQLGFNVVLNEAMSQKRQKTDVMPRKDQLRLIAAVVAVRVLTGGREQAIDWVLVATLFKDYALNFLSKRWTALLQTKKDIIDNFTSTFQGAFLTAYKNGELPPIDFDDLQAYDWKTLVDWTLETLNVSLQPKHFDLPNTRKSIGKEYEVSEKPSNIKDRELLFKAEPAAYAKIHYLASVPNTTPAVPSQVPISADEMQIDEFTLAKSLVRAAAFTPEDAYDAGVARNKLALVDKAIAEEAITTLRKEKIITARREGVYGPGRLYQANALFFQILDRKQLNLQQFTEAINFKSFLDDEFACGKECVRAEYMANEGTAMCLTQLQAHGRIRLQPVLVPITTTDEQQDRNTLPSFQIDIYPTDSYIDDSESEIIQNALDIDPPRGGLAGEIPSWYGITDQLIPEIWAKVIASFSGIVALRTGTTVDELKRTFKSTLEEWEIRRLLEWGVDIGLFERLHKDIEGWTVSEWWWVMVGRFGDLVRNDDDE